MAQTGGPEANVDAVANMLAAHIVTYLDARWTEAADSVPKPYTSAWSTTPNIQRFKRVQLQEFPVIWVGIDSGVMLDDAAPVWAEVNHPLVVKVWVQGDDAETVDRQALRFLWATWLCIQENQRGVQQYLSNFASAMPQRWARVAQEDTDVVRCFALQVIVKLLENA